MLNKKRFVVYLIMCTMLCSLAMGGCGKSTTSKEQETEQVNTLGQETTETFSDENEIRTESAPVAEYASIVEVTINPELRLYLGADSEVLAVEYLNTDARDAYEQLDLIGKSVDACMEEVVTAAIEQHYLESGETVTVNVVEVKDENIDETTICNVCYEAVQQAATEKEVAAVIKVEDSTGVAYQVNETAQGTEQVEETQTAGSSDNTSKAQAESTQNETAATTPPTPTTVDVATGETPIPENDTPVPTEEAEETEDTEVTDMPSVQPTEAAANANPCGSCGGSGKCQECMGSGYRGAGYAVSCPRCHGSFTETCGYCDAAGNSKMHEGTCDFGPCMGAHVYPCTTCGGGSKSVTCASCSGNGKCSACGGSGHK